MTTSHTGLLANSDAVQTCCLWLTQADAKTHAARQSQLKRNCRAFRALIKSTVGWPLLEEVWREKNREAGGWVFSIPCLGFTSLEDNIITWAVTWFWLCTGTVSFHIAWILLYSPSDATYWSSHKVQVSKDVLFLRWAASGSTEARREFIKGQSMKNEMEGKRGVGRKW